MGSKSKIISSEQRNENLKLQAIVKSKEALSLLDHKNAYTKAGNSAKAHLQTMQI